GGSMSRDDFIRRVLRASAVFNLGGALLFAFPGTLGALVGFPSPVPPVDAALLAWFVVLFAGLYAWIAAQPTIERTLVALGAIGKAGAFVIFFVCWLFGAASALSVVALSGDLLFAAIFAGWLLGGHTTAAAMERA